MPPSASPKRPTRARTAPVKAPRAWPKSSASASSATRDAQLNRTKGRAARREACTSASATRSLPVPLSPVSSTATSRGPTRATSEASRLMAGESKIMVRERASSPASRSFWARSRAASVARRTTARSSSGSKGLRK